jgi:hypothetical protein
MPFPSARTSPNAKKELDEGKPQIWKINGHIIDVQYDPKF